MNASTLPLRPGSDNMKLGGMVNVGRWVGLPIYSLTLEERATCPRSCEQWKNCYGNNMHRAYRYETGQRLLTAVDRQLTDLRARYPQGVLIRLHILGDFYSLSYVEFWRTQLARWPQLHLFGFTAHMTGSEIGIAIDGLLNSSPRCWIRHSNSGTDVPLAAVVIQHDGKVDPVDTIVCPEQRAHELKKAPRTCGDCGLCWTMKKRVAFLEH